MQPIKSVLSPGAPRKGNADKSRQDTNDVAQTRQTNVQPDSDIRLLVPKSKVEHREETEKQGQRDDR